jgi:hypothetical protein
MWLLARGAKKTRCSTQHLRTVRPVYCIGRAYHCPPNVAFCIFSLKSISTEYFKHAAHTVFLFKMPFIS